MVVCWAVNPNSLQEQEVLLSAKPSISSLPTGRQLKEPSSPLVHWLATVGFTNYLSLQPFVMLGIERRALHMIGRCCVRRPQTHFITNQAGSSFLSFYSSGPLSSRLSFWGFCLVWLMGRSYRYIMLKTEPGPQICLASTGELHFPLPQAWLCFTLSSMAILTGATAQASSFQQTTVLAS